jgi:hypothetical protein
VITSLAQEQTFWDFAKEVPQLTVLTDQGEKRTKTTSLLGATLMKMNSNLSSLVEKVYDVVLASENCQELEVLLRSQSPAWEGGKSWMWVMVAHYLAEAGRNQEVGTGNLPEPVPAYQVK